MPATANFPSVLINGQAGWNPLRLGPWGFVCGIDFTLTGNEATIYTDIGGGYYGEAPDWEWRQVISPFTLPAGLLDTEEAPHGQGGFSDANGMYFNTVAPSDPNRVYGGYGGYFLRSNNKGVNWDNTGLTRQKMWPNGSEARKYNPKCAVDPLNPDVVYFAGMTTGCNRSMDGGDNWTQVMATAPTPQDNSAYGLVAIDHSSASIGSGATLRKSRVIYYGKGRGVYESTDGGDSFTLLTAVPTGITQLVFDSTGALYLPSLDATLKRWEGGVLSAALVTDVNAVYSVAIDPDDDNRIVSIGPYGSTMVSIDRGLSWPYPHTGGVNVAPDFSPAAIVNTIIMQDDTLPFAQSNLFGASAGNKFRPGQVNQLWAPMGIGVCKVVLSDDQINTEANRPVWNGVNKGIEELVCRHGLSVAGHPFLVLCHDRAVFRILDPDQLPQSYGPTFQFCHGDGAAQAHDNPDYVAGTFMANNGDAFLSGYSLDGGRTFTPFTVQPTTTSGSCMAVGNAGNIVNFPGAHAQPKYSLDNGESWHNIIIPGIPNSGDRGWHHWFNFVSRQIVTNDGENFYVYNYGATSYVGNDAPTIASSIGVWRSPTGEVWERVFDEELAVQAFYSSTLTNPRGHPGHLFFTAGDVQSANPVDTRLMFGIDTGGPTMTFNEIPGFREVKHIGFGKAVEGHDYLEIYLQGYYDPDGTPEIADFSFWRCSDFDPVTRLGTWEDIGRPPSMGGMVFVKGDLNQSGRCVCGTDFGAFYWNEP